MRNLRVALCQLESHPAIYGGHVAFAEEPFVPLGDRWSLSRLGNKGIDVHTLQDYCKTEYLKWSDARLRSVVDFSTAWSRLNTSSAKSIVTGDLDGNGIDEVIVD